MFNSGIPGGWLSPLMLGVRQLCQAPCIAMPENPKKEYVVEGARFDTFDDAAAEFTRVLGLTMPWHGNLDAFNDFLRGGFGTPDERLVLVWRGSAISRERL